MVPHEGIGRGTPSPKKLRADSNITTVPTSNVLTTRSVFTRLGKICLDMIRTLLAPATCANFT